MVGTELDIPLSWSGDSVTVTFEGVAHQATVFLNGKKLYSHHCGYTAFTVDLSNSIRWGQKNILVVQVDSHEDLNQPPFGYVIDYMTYGGIYREAFLSHRPSLHITDVFIQPQIEESSIVVENGCYLAPSSIKTDLTLSFPTNQFQIEQVLTRKDTPHTIVASHTANTLTFEFPVASVSLWDVDNPVLYQMVTNLYDISHGEKVLLDSITTTIGFRHSEFRTDGYYLNGRKLKIRGLNRHQSYAYVGYAMPESMQKFDADILKKELGVNAVRTSHYPQSHHFINRCDELGLLVFTEIPGWQHIGNEAWKKQAIANVHDMVVQYRNHPSIILWGVRINESVDDDEFYRSTNEVAHKADPTRPTGGVRASKHSHLFEDVYTYNDFVHEGKKKGCEPKKNVTSDRSKPYLISEYCGHMYPTKTYDDEVHRRELARRHANILDAVAKETDIAGSFGWCMFDYNTHRDFGSGDRICYHGVLDMFRNPKSVAAVYGALGLETPVLEVSSSMDIGEHPGSLRGDTYIYTNADSVRFYKNDQLIKEFASSDSPYKHLSHGPILIDDFVGPKMGQEEHFSPTKERLLKNALNAYALKGADCISPKLILTVLRLVLFHHVTPAKALALYSKYVGDWGGSATTYRFDAIKDGKVVRSVCKSPMTKLQLNGTISSDTLIEGNTYDVAAIRFHICDENGNVLPYYQESAKITCTGDIQLIGPESVPFRGGWNGCYIKSIGKGETGQVVIEAPGASKLEFHVDVSCSK